MDLSKLSPAPWQANPSICGMGDIYTGEELWLVQGTLTLGDGGSGYFTRTDAEFIALARQAFDVIMRRGWYPRLLTDKTWRVSCDHPMIPTKLFNMDWPDPFTAIIEADRWYRENVENEK